MNAVRRSSSILLSCKRRLTWPGVRLCLSVILGLGLSLGIVLIVSARSRQARAGQALAMLDSSTPGHTNGAHGWLNETVDNSGRE